MIEIFFWLFILMVVPIIAGMASITISLYCEYFKDRVIQILFGIDFVLAWILVIVWSIP